MNDVFDNGDNQPLDNLSDELQNDYDVNDSVDDDVNVYDDNVNDDAADDVDDNNDDDTNDDAGNDADDVDTGNDNTSITFTKEQQEHVNKIVQSRLERAERAWEKKLIEAAGTELEIGDDGGEVLQAARLWGFLKLNPELSRQIDTVINQYISRGNYIEPQKLSEKDEQVLKEAVYDLRLSDSTFNKNYQKVFDWAEEQGIDIDTPAQLKLAYKAWKAENLINLEAQKQLSDQRKARKAKNARKAVLEGSKTRGKSQVDFTKMSDEDILAAEGLSLFTED